MDGFCMGKRKCVLWRGILFLLLIVTLSCNKGNIRKVQAEGAPKETELYAKGAVLLDADSGRVLYGKNEDVPMPMASTTKIMTLIVVLENANLEDVVTASANAARQPKVHLGMEKQQQFKLEDLCYSLMLESHNDSAVALAEYVAGSVEAFAVMMNDKARDLGCSNTYFITPNGLDATVDTKQGKKVHSTTAKELACILRYCIKISPCKDKFLEITRTQSHSFTDISGKRSYSCNNHNAFLQMMEGALTGKTGFTGNAGYCYVGALQRDERTYIVALLACGWPNNKTYKWKDTRRLMEYGIQNYTYHQVFEKREKFDPVPVLQGCIVENGQAKLWEDARIKPYMKEESLILLMNPEEKVDIRYKLDKDIIAPIEEGEIIGRAEYYLNGTQIGCFPVYSCNKIVTFNLELCMKEIKNKFLL